MRALAFPDRFGNMFDFILQSLRSTAHVPTISVARKLANNIILMWGRQYIFFCSRKQLSCCKYNTWFHCRITVIDCQFYLTSELHRNRTQSLEAQVYKAFSWSIFHRGIKLFQLLGYSGLNHLVWIAIGGEFSLTHPEVFRSSK